MTAAISKARSWSRDRSGFPDAKAGRTMSGCRMAVNGTVATWIRRRSFRAGRPKHAVASLTVENYVKTIALIAARNPEGSLVGTGELAQALSVSPGTVTGMLKTLSEGNLATYTPYEGARLTESGQRLAMKVIRRHRLLERFLAETLTMSWDEVHEEAEHMEHAASERLIDRIDAYLGYPAVDPHGDPIPRADGSLAQIEGVPLARCQAGQHFRVVRVMDQDPAFLRYLSECGLELHAAGELLENRPEAGALVCLLGGRNVALGLAAAGKLLVVVTPQGNSSSPSSKQMRPDGAGIPIPPTTR
jgi:DtxR family transcriptional regulator, Mn-dependent transcriptional regulator